MSLRQIAKLCSLGDCPTVYEIDGNETDVAVQGYVTGELAPNGEAIVRIPKELLLQAAAETA